MINPIFISSTIKVIKETSEKLIFFKVNVSKYIPNLNYYK